MLYTYKKLSIMKIVLGLIILVSTLFSINVFTDEVLGMTLFLLGVFLLSRGTSYFAFRLLQYAMKQYHKYEHEKMTEAYKLAFLFGCFIVTNIMLIVMNKWTRLLGINLLLGFVIIQIILIYDRDTND